MIDKLVSREREVVLQGAELREFVNAASTNLYIAMKLEKATKIHGILASSGIPPALRSWDGYACGRYWFIEQ